ncbi:hypothetical protein EVAR_70770_1 [Eumeta japonica]|uniref:Uncharacterized protein n=1 Tax=Eumeta variegata TaxID=151549 RepID=A0A4C2A4K6_EUMVA|nr:hypothetical protein EVAR_70770_1 [Eumeta japonica]
MNVLEETRVSVLIRCKMLSGSPQSRSGLADRTANASVQARAPGSGLIRHRVQHQHARVLIIDMAFTVFIFATQMPKTRRRKAVVAASRSAPSAVRRPSSSLFARCGRLARKLTGRPRR